MKKLRFFFSVSLVAMASLATVYAMEPFVGEYPFLKSFIFDIQNEARDLTQDTGVEYKIVTEPVLFEKCLKVLGLGYNSTPLDIRYHYELMKEKLADRNGLLNVITKAYNQLIYMFSEIKKYRQETQHLVKMPFEELQVMELEDKENFMHNFFLDSKDVVIDKTITWLKKEHQQYVTSHQVSGLPIILQTAFSLPVDAPAYVVDEHYKRYMQNHQDYLNQLIAHATMKNISTQKLKAKLSEVEKVSKVYEQYVQKRGGGQL